MKLFNIKLSDEHRATLEAYRAQHGLRSAADAVRHLINACAASRTYVGESNAASERPKHTSRLKGEWKAP